MKHIPQIAIILLTICFYSCKDDDTCTEVIQGPQVELSEASNAYVQNYSDATKIIFTDENNNEVEFLVNSFDRTFTPYSGGVPCPEDNTRSSVIQGEGENVEISLSNASLSESIIIRMWAFPDFFVNSTTQLMLQYGNLNESLTDSEFLMIHTTDVVSDFTVEHDNLVLADRTFNNVIEVNSINPGFEVPAQPSLEVKYTDAQGIVEINDLINNRILVYLRKE